MLASVAALWLSGCTQAAKGAPGTVPPATPQAPATPAVASSEPAFTALESQFDARLGVWALHTANGLRVEHNADERFAFCSTHKAFSAAAVLHANPVPALDTVVHYAAPDPETYAPIASQHVDTGMTLRALCDAAVRFSDNTAANLLFDQLGGPPGLQSFIRSLNDTVTDSSRVEPDLNSATPGDVRDTTTPRAWGQDLQQVVLGDVLPSEERQILTDWLVGNTTGNGLIRAAAPAGWKVGDKTGNGGYGARNDIAVLWPPNAEPIVMVVMSSRPKPDDRFDDQLIAKAAEATLNALT